MTNKMKDIIKAGIVLAFGFAALVLFINGVERGNGLMTSIAAFLGLAAWGMAQKMADDEKDRKSGLDKAVNDELKYNGDHERA